MVEDGNPLKETHEEPKETREERFERETKPPDGQRLILHSLRFAEVVRAEDYEKLETGLDLLYQGVKKNSYGVQREQENYRQYISGAKSAFFPSGWVNLQGFISKEYADSLEKPIMGPKRELPPGIERMSFFLGQIDRKSTRLNSSHGYISYAVFCLKNKNWPPARQNGSSPHGAPNYWKTRTTS